MTYRFFLATILAPQITLAAIAFALRSRQATRTYLRRDLALTAILVLVAVTYTAPWDRWLILHTVWTYPPHSVIGTVGAVPIEEYLFMVGQTTLTTLWALTVVPGLATSPPAPAQHQATPHEPAQHQAARRAPAQRQAARRAPARHQTAQRWRQPVFGTAWLMVALAGLTLAAGQRTLYLGAILLWYAPPLALQAAAGADVLRRARPWRLLALAPTALLWISDDVAIHTHAWHIAAAHTTGLTIVGLPIEEAVFFLLTNLLVVNSVVLLADPQLRARLTPAWRRRPTQQPGELPLRVHR